MKTDLESICISIKNQETQIRLFNAIKEKHRSEKKEIETLIEFDEEFDKD